MKQGHFVKKLLKGAGSILDIMPTPPRNPIANKSDAERLKSDWRVVGDDLRKSMEIIDNEQKRSR